MRLKAKTYLTYAGKEWAPGQLFDAPKTRALVMIDRGDAEPFLLEDPSQRTLEDAIDNLLPAEPPAPSPPAEVSLSPDVAPALASGGTGSVTVTILVPGSWVVTGDPAAPWLTFTPTAPQSAAGTISWTAGANATGEDRQGILSVNGEPFTVNQSA